MRFEFRWIGDNIADGNDKAVLNVGSLQVRVANGSQLWISEFYDSVPNNGCDIPKWTGNAHSDVLIRVTRMVDGAAGTLRLEAYDIAAGPSSMISCSVPIAAIAANPTSSFANVGIAIGGPGATGGLGFLRWFSAPVPAGTPIPMNPLMSGDLADYELQNNTQDSSGNHADLRASASSYVANPLYAPTCDAGATRAFRIGSSGQLDASKSTALMGNTLTYSWKSLSAPEDINWTSPTNIATPTFTPGTFGTYAFQLTVTDSFNTSSSCTVKHGAVATEQNTDVVVISDPNISLLLSPMLRLGASPWKWYDNQHRYLGDFFGSLQSTDYLDVWNTPLAGTISVNKGKNIVTGDGTSFLHDLCAGGNSGNNAFLVIWYPVGDGTFGRWPATINSCDSDTQVTIGSAYQMSPDATGLAYSFMTNAQVFTWINTSTNVNYYDNVMAFYALYYRTGIDTYLQYARTLADRWWTMPWIDQGRSCQLTGIGACLSARQRSFTGLVLRALDGRPDMWPGLRNWFDTDRYFITRTNFFDTREQGYQLADVSLCALFDPDSTHKQLCSTDLLTSLSTLWLANEQPGGYWMNPSYGYATWNGSTGTVNVTHGSTLVEGVGTNWVSGMFPAGYVFWVTNSPGDSQKGDPVSYSATFVDDSHILLDRPYEGATSSGHGWENNNLVGYGTQPFVVGIAANAFYLAYLATGDPRPKKMLLDSAYWITQNGYRAPARGLYYGRYFVNCTPISENLPNCSADPFESARFFAGEVMNTFSRAYILSGDRTLLSMGDNLFGAMFGKPGFGGLQGDDIYLTEIDVGGLAVTSKKAKDFGFFFGFGQSWSWPAARLARAPQLIPRAGVPAAAARVR